nr:hypothetical protein [Tanacetum cinerariifolium]
MASLAAKAILSGADNRPPILEKDMYDSWKSRMELYMINRPHGKMILESVEQGPLIWPTVEVEGLLELMLSKRSKKNTKCVNAVSEELTAAKHKLMLLMRIEQYFLMTDYSLWEVILNGDSFVPTRIVEGVAQLVAPTTVEQKLARKNELK